MMVETGETCDDGNLINGDGCDDMCQIELVDIAFRMDTLLLRDPHAYTSVFFSCADITGQLNGVFDDLITTDDDGDGNLDLSIVSLFKPFDSGATSTPVDIIFADCTDPIATTTCTVAGTPINSTATNQSAGTCLVPVPGTTGGYSPAITTPDAPCFVTDKETLTIDANGLIITLNDAQVAATYISDTNLTNGLLMGFITEANADATLLPAGTPIVGGDPLSSILPGGTGNCNGGDARDMGPDGSGGTTIGWWLYLNFTSVQVPYTP